MPRHRTSRARYFWFPGTAGTPTRWLPLEIALRAAGRQVVVVTPAGDGTGDLRAEADHLADVAASTLDRTGAPSVDVIGYSAGGVVARLWVRDGNGKTAARRVLTLGSRHGCGAARQRARRRVSDRLRAVGT